MFDELKQSCHSGGYGGFLPGMKQIANVAALPGIVGKSIGLPDVHSGYGFAIGNMAAFDMSDPTAVVSPGGVGFDINCGVRLLRTNLFEKDILPVKEQLAQTLHIAGHQDCRCLFARLYPPLFAFAPVTYNRPCPEVFARPSN